MRFEIAHEEFLKYHMKGRTGENLRRFKEGHGHANKMFLEKVWWPSFDHFDHLYPEYEVDDFKDGKRYLDFAYLRPPFQVCIEIDGFGPHWQDLNRWKFADNLIRQNHLVIDGWKVLRFSYDDVKDHPRRCQQIVQQLIGRWLVEEPPNQKLNYIEREVIRIAMRKGAPITIGNVASHLGVGNKKAKTLLGSLVEKKWIIPLSGFERIHFYGLNPRKSSDFDTLK
jgi:hypothetical protein